MFYPLSLHFSECAQDFDVFIYVCFKNSEGTFGFEMCIFILMKTTINGPRKRDGNSNWRMGWLILSISFVFRVALLTQNMVCVVMFV